jgi:Phage integrase family
MNIDTHINEAAKALREEDSRFSSGIINRVSRYIRENVDMSSGKPVITDPVLRRIRDKLIDVSRDPRSPQTILHWKCYNQMNWRLSDSCQFQSNDIRTPKKTRRHLLIHTNDLFMMHLDCVAALIKEMISLDPPASGDAASAEIHYACLFITAAAVHAKMIFRKFHRYLLELKAGDVFFNPHYLTRRVDGSNAINPHSFLFYPVNIFLNRLILACGNKNPWDGQSDDFPLFSFTSFTIKTFSDVYRAWSKNILQKWGIVTENGIGLDDLRMAVRASSVLDSRSPESGTGPFPLFIISAMSGEVKNFSFANDSFSMLIPGYKPPRSDYRPKVRKSSLIEIQDIDLYRAIREITSIRRKLVKAGKNKANCQEAEGLILSVVAKFENFLEPVNHINFWLYTRWIIFMIHKYRKVSSANTNASILWSVLSALSDLNREAFYLSDDDYTAILTRLAEHYVTDKILIVLTAFLSFVREECGNTFEVPDLHRMARKLGLDIKKRPSLKPCVSFDALEGAIDSLISGQIFTGDFLHRLFPIENAGHLPFTRKHVASLTYYTGLRISEITEAKLTDLFPVYGGIWLFVRDTKTDHGRRFLPLSYLLPASYLAEFEEYLVYRKSLPTDNDYIFLNSVYNQWDDKSLTETISAAFRKQGLPDFSFHVLRHAFGNNFLLIWTIAFFKVLVPQDTPFLKNELFSDEHIKKFKKLFLGMGAPKKGRESFSYVLQVLATLYGHGGPITQLEYYIHNISWIYYFFANHYEIKHIFISPKQAKDLLQVSYPSIPDELIKDWKIKQISTKELSDEQMNIMKKRFPNLFTSQTTGNTCADK